MRTIEHKTTGQRREVSEQTWSNMSSRGDTRNWKTIKASAPEPSEITTAMETLKRKKKEAQPPEVPAVGADEENE